MMSFPSASFLMFHQQLLTVLGIPFLVYTGEMTPAARHKVLKEFQAAGRDGPRVLIISKIGSTGLNLSCANIVIAIVSAHLSIP